MLFRSVFAAALVVGGVTLTILLLGTSLYLTRKKLRAAQADSTALRLNLATAESLVKAEPQTLVYWEQGQGLRIVTQTVWACPRATKAGCSPLGPAPA